MTRAGTSRREELQSSFLRPHPHRGPGRARRHLAVTISKFHYYYTSAQQGIEPGSPVARFSQSQLRYAGLLKLYQESS